MTQAIALAASSAQQRIQLTELVRSVVVMGCALALIFAKAALPF